MQKRAVRWAILCLIIPALTIGGATALGRAAWPPADPPSGSVAQATLGPTDPISLAQGGNGASVPGEVLVRFRPPPGNAVVRPDRPATILTEAGMKATVARPLEGVEGFVVNVPAGQEAEAANLLTAAPDVIAAAPNLVRHIHRRLLAPSLPVPLPAPNDPLYPVQWGYGRINAPPAWGLAQRAVTVAVLDTGLDNGHPEFTGRVVAGANFVQAGQPPTDDNGHGTHVSGIIAAAGGNGIGGVGVAWQARIMPIKVADSSGNLSSEAWLNGIAFAVAHGAQVINMSFGGTTFSSTEQAYISDAWNHGVVLVASAGNSGDAGNPIEYPAGYTNVVSVAATGPDNSRAYYSESNRFVTVAAPGGDAHFSNDPEGHFIISTWPLGLGSNYQTGYGREIGTSQAAPFVSGLAALMFGTGTGWTNATLVDRITATATDLGPAGRDDSYGFGLINVAAAVGNPPGPPSPPTALPTVAPPPPTFLPATLTPTPHPPTAIPPPTVTPRPSPTPTLGPGCLYTDLCPGDPALPFVQDLQRHDALNGYADRSFRPSANLSRAQAAKLVTLATGAKLITGDGPEFADVPPTDPFYPYIETARSRGLIGGYSDGAFDPYSAISRGQLAKLVVLARGWHLVDPGVSNFSDVSYGSALSYYIETAAAFQVLPGFPDRTFHPDDPVTRGAAARIVDVALATYRP